MFTLALFLSELAKGRYHWGLSRAQSPESATLVFLLHVLLVLPVFKVVPG